KQIGLLTIHDINNYGSVLQAYATLRAIDLVKGGVELIDYKYPNALHNIQKGRWTSLKNVVLSRGNSILKDLLPGMQYSTYVDRYEKAKQDWYQLGTQQYLSREAVVQSPPMYDSYVVGSDQVWHPRTAANDPTFFLDFAPKQCRKLSYGSSFG